MRITYDPVAEAVYVYVDEKLEVDSTKQINSSGVFVDVGQGGGEVHGIEILGVREAPMVEVYGNG